jgi:hypothetical protein
MPVTTPYLDGLLDLSGPTSEYRREDPASPRHIRAIAVAKGLQHHSLFPCDAAKEQNPKTDKPSESVFGRVVVVSFFIITLSIWLPIIAGAIALSLIGHLWSRIRGEPTSSNQEKNAARGRGWC